MFSSQTSIRRRMRVLFTLSLEGSGAPASPARRRRTPSPLRALRISARGYSVLSLFCSGASCRPSLAPRVLPPSTKRPNEESNNPLPFHPLTNPYSPNPFPSIPLQMPLSIFHPRSPVHDRNAASSFLSCAYALCPCTTRVGGVRTFKPSNIQTFQLQNIPHTHEPPQLLSRHALTSHFSVHPGGGYASHSFVAFLCELCALCVKTNPQPAQVDLAVRTFQPVAAPPHCLVLHGSRDTDHRTPNHGALLHRVPNTVYTWNGNRNPEAA
jgi:hypothetical protein